MNIIIKNLTLATLISVNPGLLMCSQAQESRSLATITSIKQHSALSPEVKRQKALKEVLADCLTDMPLDLIKIIAEYEPHRIEGVLQTCLTGHQDQIRTLLALPDNTCASASNDRTIKIWNVSTGRCLQTLEEHRHSVYLLILLPDGRLMSFDTGGCIIAWKKNNENRWVLEHMRKTQNIIQASTTLPNNICAFGLQDGSIEFWQENRQANQWECTRKVREHAQCIFALATLAQGRFVSSSPDKLIVWTPQKSSTDANAWIYHILEETSDNSDQADPGLFSLITLADNSIISATPREIRVYQEIEKTLSCCQRFMNFLWPSQLIERQWLPQQTLAQAQQICSLAALPDKQFATKDLFGVLTLYAYNPESKQWKATQSLTGALKATDRTRGTLIMLSNGKLASSMNTLKAKRSDPVRSNIEIWA